MFYKESSVYFWTDHIWTGRNEICIRAPHSASPYLKKKSRKYNTTYVLRRFFFFEIHATVKLGDILPINVVTRTHSALLSVLKTVHSRGQL
jgi:hypothetical protein